MGVPRQVQSPLLVGRDDVLQLAERRIADAAAGRGGSLLVAGEAGIGKSRLIAAMTRTAAAAGFRHAKGDLAPNDRLVPLASVLDLARTMSRIDAFGSLGPDLLALEPDGGGDTLGHRRRFVHDVADRLLRAIDEPTLLAFDDLQWSDELSLEVIGELARRAHDRPLLVIAGYRAAELAPGSVAREWRARLLAQRIAEEVRLTPLDREQTALVTTLILGTGLPAPRDVAAAVYERTDGIPLHVEELLAALDDEARLDGRRIREAHVPDTIEDAVLARYRRLSPEARAVARAGAVVGRCFVPEVVAGILDRQPDALDDAFHELVDQAFLHPFNFLDRGYYDFRHQLLRDALYGTVEAGELRRFHARAAEFGSLSDGASEAHASLHFERAGLRAEAYRAALAGARHAASVSSRHEAFELYQRAVANVPAGLTPDELAVVWLEYADAASAVDDVPAIRLGAREGRRYAVEAGMALEAAQALVFELVADRRDVAPREVRTQRLAAATAELDALPDSPDRSALLTEVHVQAALLACDAMRLEEARAHVHQARRHAREAGQQETADLDWLEASFDVQAGDDEAGLAAMLSASRAARGRNSEATGVTGLRWTAAAAIRVMAYETADVAIDEGLAYADEIEQSYCRHVLAASSAMLAWTRGDWDVAVAIAELEMVEPASRRGRLGSIDALGFVAMSRGEHDRADRLFTESIEVGAASGELELVLPAIWGAAELALLDGDPEAAYRRCEEALAITTPNDERALLVPFVVTGTRAALAARRPDLAERWLDGLRPLLAGWTRLSAPALAHADGLLRTASGSTIAARASLEAAVSGWEALGRTWEACWARLDLAACLLRANRDAEAVPVLRAVRTRAVELGSMPLERRADELLALARSRGAEEEPWRPLTAREFEVARLIADGLTNAAIAERLGLSPRTVGAHVEHILAKLDVARRAEIASWVAGVRAPVAGRAAAVDEARTAIR